MVMVIVTNTLWHNAAKILQIHLNAEFNEIKYD